MTDPCENIYDENGNPINGSTPDVGNTGFNSCVPADTGHNAIGAALCPTTGNGDPTCKPWQLINDRINCYADSLVNEHLNIGAANINVFKLLGIHEQGQLVDITGKGEAISNGDAAGFPKEQAFTTFLTEWRSLQTGPAILASAYIGYDFGEIKLDNGRRRYGIETSIKHNISTIKLKQGNNPNNRVTKVRVERSEDGIKWYGTSILTLPNDDCLNTIHFRNTVPMRYWRLRPIEFGGGIGDYWAVQAFELMDYDLTSIEDVQDKIWNENRDRDYATESILVKGTYDPANETADISRFGLELPSQIYEFKMGFSATIAALGRPPVVGDIFEIPSEIQFDANLQPIRKYMEVIDVGWDSEGYTPGWFTTLLRVSAAPLMATQETADIFGGLETYDDGNGTLVNKEGIEMETGIHPIFQDYSDLSQTIEQTATDREHTPERGRDPADIHQFTDSEAEQLVDQGVPYALKLGLQPKQLYVEDAMPPNGLPFTEGDALPPTNTANDGDYHRLTYESIDETIPARLYRYSSAKNRWIFMESDKRAKYKETRPRLQEFVQSGNATDAGKIA